MMRLTPELPAPLQPWLVRALSQTPEVLFQKIVPITEEKMPAEFFPYKPAPEVMTYAGLLGHIIDVQYGFCNAVKGGTNPAAGKGLDKLTDKAALVTAVNETFAYCDDAFAALTNENALEMLSIGTAPNQRQVARANQLTMVIAHGNEHYGNLVTYMRIHGIVPPSSTPR